MWLTLDLVLGLGGAHQFFFLKRVWDPLPLDENLKNDTQYASFLNNDLMIKRNPIWILR